MFDNPLHLLMNPKSVAVVGAGNNPMKMGAIQALSIIKDGYQGKFYPIHLTEKTVFGYQAYASVYDLPEPPDLVMFVLPAPLVLQLMEDFGKIGTRRAIIISAGFKEVGPAGRHMEEQLKEVARRYGIRFLGPNCMGIINSALSLNVTVMPLPGKPGSLGMASQSGTYITQTLPYLQRRGIRFSKAVSVGNEGDIDIVDALEYLGFDEQTKAIALYIEGLKDGRRFIETARRITPHKPVVAQYVGGSVAGARSGLSHTGAMAGPDHIYDGMFKQTGIIRADSIEELYNQGWALAVQPPLKGRRIGVLTNSGGPGTAIAHTCNEGGLEVPLFSEQLQAQIKRHITPQGSAANPVDLTFHLNAEVLSAILPELILSSGEVDGIVAHGLMGTGFMKAIYPHVIDLFGGINEEEFVSRLTRDLAGPVSIPGKYKMPMILSSFFGREDNHTVAYQDHNIPVFDAPEKAARGMLALHQYSLIKAREQDLPFDLPAYASQAEELIRKALQHGRRSLDEYDSKKLLAAYGVPISEEGLAHSAEEAVTIALAIGYPVAVKGCSPDFAHKTGQGLIHLGLKKEEDIRVAYLAVAEAAGYEIPVIVSKMIPGQRELMAGMVRYPAFGPCVMFGLGGVFAEALHDTVFRVAPLSTADIRTMITSIKSQAILQQFRGMPEVDIEALGAILQTVGSLGLLHPEIQEIDLNPIIISGSTPVVVDALIGLQPIRTGAI